jgi:hypothetical protein
MEQEKAGGGKEEEEEESGSGAARLGRAGMGGKNKDARN